MDTNAVWSKIDWVNVERAGIHNQFGIGGFERQYGSIVYYPYSEIDNKIYDRPLWHVFLKFWAKVGGTWYKQYITVETAKTPRFFEIEPLSGNVSGEWEIGWNGTVSYGAYSFPVYVGLRARRDSPYMSIKTNITTPLALKDHAIEYELYLNPFWKGYAEKNVEYVRVEFLNGTTRDFNITQVMDCTNEVPDMVKTFSFLNLYKNVTINNFDFSDVFGGNGTKLAKIESVTLPNGQSTYVVKVGATFGSLASGQKLVVDPNFGYETIGGSSSALVGISCIIKGSVFSLAEAGTADNITVAVKKSAAGTMKIKCAIYLHSDLSLVAQTEEVLTSLTTSFAWYTYNFGTPPSLTASTEYVLVVWGGPTDGYTTYIAYNAGDTNQGHYKTLAYTNNFPNPLVPTHDNNKYSIYCTYMVSEAHSTVTTTILSTESSATDSVTVWSVILVIVDPVTTVTQTSITQSVSTTTTTSTTSTSTYQTSTSTSATITSTLSSTYCTTLSSTSTETIWTTATVTSTSTETSWATTTLPTTSTSTSLTTTTLPTTSTETSLSCTTLQTTSISTSLTTTTLPTTTTETSLTCTTLQSTSTSTSWSTTTFPTTSTETSLTCTTLETTSTSISSTTTTTGTTSVSTSLTCTTLPTTSTSVSSTTTTIQTTSIETSETTTTTQATSTLTSMTCTTLPTTSTSTALTCTTLGTTSTSTSTSLECTTLPTTSTSTSLTCTTLETTTTSTSLTCTTLETTSVSTSSTCTTFPTTSTETSLTCTTLETTSTSVSATTTATETTSTSTSLTCTTLPITSISTSLTCTTLETTSISTSETTTTLESTTSSITTTTFSTTSISTSLTCTTFQFTETSMSLTTTTSTFTQSQMTVTTLTVVSTITTASSTTWTYAATTITMTSTMTVGGPGAPMSFMNVFVCDWRGNGFSSVNVTARDLSTNYALVYPTANDGNVMFQLSKGYYEVSAKVGSDILSAHVYHDGSEPTVTLQLTALKLVLDFLMWNPLFLPNWLWIVIAAIIISYVLYLIFKSA